MANFLRPISHYIPIFRVTRLWSSGPPLPGDGKIPFQYFTAYALSLVAVARRVVNTGGKQARAKPRFSWGLVAPFPIRWTTGEGGNRRCKRRPTTDYQTGRASPHAKSPCTRYRSAQLPRCLAIMDLLRSCLVTSVMRLILLLTAILTRYHRSAHVFCIFFPLSLSLQLVYWRSNEGSSMETVTESLLYSRVVKIRRERTDRTRSFEVNSSSWQKCIEKEKGHNRSRQQALSKQS